MKSHVLLMMGGSGTRLGADIPKQYIEIDGKPIFVSILELLEKLNAVDDIVIVSHADWIPFVREWTERVGAGKVVAVAAGGETRSHSVRNGLRALAAFAEDDDPVLMHDATHPYVDEEGTRQVIRAIREYGGATLGEYQYDTVYQIESTEEGDFVGETLNRRLIVAGASPEGFRYRFIRNIYENASDEELASMTSAGAIARAHGIRMKVIPCSVVNLKITHRVDLEALQQSTSYFYKTH